MLTMSITGGPWKQPRQTGFTYRAVTGCAQLPAGGRVEVPRLVTDQKTPLPLLPLTLSGGQRSY